MADLGKILQAAPIGLLMLVGSYVAAKRRQSGAARAVKEYPGLAEKLGLSVRSAGAGKIGALAGEYQGFRVYVDPDERPRVAVYFEGTPQLALRTYEHEKRAPAGMTSFATRNAAVDRFFKNRYADEERARHLTEHADELEKLLSPFAVRWAPNVEHLSITPERIECAVQFGRPIHIPSEAAESLLLSAVALARFIEPPPAP
jgi:hypothetical protein